ncbi:MAG: DUF1287 domain-containing protein, partial [Luteolibacter sp.]
MKAILTIILATALTTHAQTGAKLAASARQQISVTVSYDPAYITLAYPDGDVPKDRGVCTDVVIRAMRVGLAKDLQKLIHEDMRANFSIYPKNWGLARPDRNIDHRRVPNLKTWLKRQGYQLQLGADKNPAKFLPGDLVTCTIPPHLPHIMVVSDRTSEAG